MQYLWTRLQFTRWLVTVVRCHDHDGGGHGRGEDKQDGDGQETLKVLSGYIHKNSYENLTIVIQIRSSLFLKLTDDVLTITF